MQGDAATAHGSI